MSTMPGDVADDGSDVIPVRSFFDGVKLGAIYTVGAGVVLFAAVTGIHTAIDNSSHEAAATLARQLANARCEGFREARAHDPMSDADRMQEILNDYGWISGGCWRPEKTISLEAGHKLIKDADIDSSVMPWISLGSYSKIQNITGAIGRVNSVTGAGQ